MSAISITAANVLASAQAIKEQCIAGATITAGQVVYLDTSTGTVKLADADASATTARAYGIALGGASSGQPILICKEDPDFTPGGTLSISAAADDAVYILDGTAGAFCPIGDIAAGDYPVVIGVAKSATKMFFKIVGGGSGAAALTA